ncbi:glycosyltransferase family 2 protein [Bacteroidota bacterium]
MKKISVILTTHNSEKTIQRALDSISNQNGLNEIFTIELVVIDDCSSDNTVSILKKNDIKFISTERNSGGPNKGRNIGLRKATGDFICIVDHDDEWDLDKIKLQLAVEDKAPIITSGFTTINKLTNRRTSFVNPSNDSSGYNYYGINETFLKKLSKSIHGQYTYSGSIMLHKRLKEILFEENFGMIDFDRRLKLFEGNASIEVCKSLYNRYVEASNLSLDENYRRIDFYFSLMVLEQYEDKYPKEVALAYKRVFGTRARYFYFMGNMPKARKYLRKAPFNLKTILYYLTTFWGHNFVKKKKNLLT